MSHIHLILPWPPSVNRYWGSRGNRRFINKAGREFRQMVSEICSTMNVQSLNGRLAMFVALFPPDKRERDLDNYLKATQDACEHAGCYQSDSQIDHIQVIRQDTCKGGRCAIVIVEVSEEPSRSLFRYRTPLDAVRGLAQEAQALADANRQSLIDAPSGSGLFLPSPRRDESLD